MGNRNAHSSHASGPTEAMLAEWENISSGFGAPTWRHRVSGQELEEYKYMAQSAKDLTRLRNLFEFRRDKPHLVATKFFLDHPQKELCGSHHLVSMFTERIYVRLNQFKDVPHPDILHVYSNAFAGFEELYRKVGYFHADEHMVGANHQGRVKVWFNQDFSCDRPNTVASQTGRTANDMVVQIIQLIDRHTQHINPTYNPAKFLLERHSSTFADARVGLNAWAATHHTVIPETLQGIAKLIHSGHFMRTSPTRRTESVIRRENDSSRVVHLHNLLAQEKVLTEVEEIIAPTAQFPSVLSTSQMSKVPIYGQTPVGLRPLSPARIIIRAQSPVPVGHSALEIRPHSPLPGQYAQPHPILLQQNIPLGTFMHPREATTIVTPIHPLAHPATTRSTITTHPPINNQQLLALQKKIQSELDRVNALVNATHASTNFDTATTQNQTVTPVNSGTSATAAALTTTVDKKLFTFSATPQVQKVTTESSPSYKTYEIKRQTASVRAQPTAPITKSLEIKKINEVTTAPQSTYNYSSLAAATDTTAMQRSPVSAAVERPKIYLTEKPESPARKEATVPIQTTTTYSYSGSTPSSKPAEHVKYQFESTKNESATGTGLSQGFGISAGTANTFNFSDNQRLANTNTVHANDVVASTSYSTIDKPVESYTVSTYHVQQTSRRIETIANPSLTNYSSSFVHKEGTPYSFESANSRELAENDTYRLSGVPSVHVAENLHQSGGAQTLATDGFMKRSFDRSTNIIRISAQSRADQEGIKVLYHG